MGRIADDRRDRRFSRWTLAFADRRLERAYVAEHNRRAVGPLRVILLMMLAVVGVGAVGDWWTSAHTWEAMIPWRIAGVSLAALGFGLTFVPAVVARGQPVAAGIGVALHAAVLGATPLGAT